ncbi:10616_t:CDS:2 [Dentiscutata erythropus]|uniref:10616_t:CDS:1 n=1 Tax=Dentiscutata erythropus TaxID=1348616 RepID=A0A9N9FKH3_9GLOM|nr:10616_t:CDS:2 [Dentiscutata erythropus]
MKLCVRMKTCEEFRKNLHDIIIKQISRNNEPEEAYKCVNTLNKVVGNIIESPYDEAKRQLKENNKIVKSTIRESSQMMKQLEKLEIALEEFLRKFKERARMKEKIAEESRKEIVNDFNNNIFILNIEISKQIFIIVNNSNSATR